MAASHHVEIEAAKFLQKLIQESKDEPAKLATKLYVICQHMKMSGKEQSLPYQVISRAMETVIHQHGLNLEVLKQSHLPLAGGPQIGDSSNARSMDRDTPENQMQVGSSDMPLKGTPIGPWHSGSSSKTREDNYGGPVPSVGVLRDPKQGFSENDIVRHDSVNPNRPPVGPGRVDTGGHEFYHGSVSQRSNALFDHESPSSLDTRSANSQEMRDCGKPDKRGRKKEPKKPTVKRKRGDSTSVMDASTDNLQFSGNTNTGVNPRKGKMMNKVDMKSQFNDKAGEQSQVNSVQNIANVDHFSSVSSGMGSTYRGKQDNQSSNSTSNHIEEGEVPGRGSVGIQKAGHFPFGHDIPNPRTAWDQFKVGLPVENSQYSRFAPNSSISMKETQLTPPGSCNKETKSNAFEFSGNSSEGTTLIKAGQFWGHGVPFSAQTTGEESVSNEAEHGVLGQSSDTMNSIPQGMTGLSGSMGKVSGGTSGTFSPYGTVKTGLPTQAQFNSSSFNSHDIALKLHQERSGEASSGSQLLEVNKEMMAFDTSQKSLSVATKVAVTSDNMQHGFLRGSGSVIREKGTGVRLGHPNLEEETSPSPSARKDLEQEGGTSYRGNTYKMVQGSGSQGPQGTGNFDAGKLPTSQAVVSPGLPFREHHLKQLRAQCLVFLAFRNGLVPRKLHLDIALGVGESYTREDASCRELNKSDETTTCGRSFDMREPGKVPPSSSSTGFSVETDASPNDTEKPKKSIEKGPSSENSALPEEMKRFESTRSESEGEMRTQEMSEPHGALARTSDSDSVMNHRRYLSESSYQKEVPVGSGNRMYSSVSSSMPGTVCYNDASREASAAAMFKHGPVIDNIENSQSQAHGDFERGEKLYKPEFPVIQENHRTDSRSPGFTLKEQTKPLSRTDLGHSRDVNAILTNVSRGESAISNCFVDAFVAGESCALDTQRVSETQKQWNSDSLNMVTNDDSSNHGNPLTVMENFIEQEEEYTFISTDKSPSPKYTTSEKWLMDHQKRKLLDEQNWELKQKKTEERIAASFEKLKESASSSENISSKTKSVIELKKLQLLQLQRRLRSDFLHDFFKPVLPDMERLKSIKKYKHGRRLKQLEKYEQKMKEERLKRIRERQKEFFSEVEAHKERQEDWFKIKRERWKSFNKYVKEFHKRKERIHREKLDRIQREKINLLKNNDVEGYLRMVQDAKSDRVKQLLKETEKYLQKLGSKLQEAKSMARQFEMEMDDNRAANVIEKNEIAVENEDENDQAEHYLESNEKYYLMAHSIKESIMEQPTSLLGGRLREYQMNGLRWLVSLYNNHLNGILADEMGLGKTVQVIALICYLMEAKNDRGPFLVVVPSSVLPGWVSEINFWAPGINKIAYAGPPEERRKLFKERIIPQKFNVLVTTYEYLMNKHDRPKLSKVHWHYIIIDEGHRIKNASCKLNADLKHYQSTHRLLLTGTPLQNNLEELWALLNFLLPNIFNSSEDFSQWFNKPFESGGETSPDQALLSEEENLLIINRLHQVLRPFVLRRLKHKVEHELPEKIERLVRCEASAYQKLLIKRVEDNLGTIGSTKGRTVHNSVMEMRNICNHPYLSQLHAEEVDSLIPKHYLPSIVRLCGKLEMLDRLLPKLKATDHRVLFFSTMTRLLDVMEDYLRWKQYRYLRLDGHTSGSDRGALIEEFNRPDSPVFIFLLSIRAGGVGVNLQAADTVIIFDTDWNPQVDLQAQARAHRIGQKKDVLVLRLETVRTVEEQVRAAAEHKLGVANQSITAGFFDNNTSAEDRREYLETLLRECKKEETAHVLDDDALNNLLARSESEIDVFEAIDKQRGEEEMEAWEKLVEGPDKVVLEPLLPIPSRLVTDDDLKALYKAMQIYEESNAGLKRKNESVGGLDTQHYGRGKRAREVRSYEDQWTEEEFEKMCQADSPESPKLSSMTTGMPTYTTASNANLVKTEQLCPLPSLLPLATPSASAAPQPSPPPLPLAAASVPPAPAPAPAAAAAPSLLPPPQPPQLAVLPSMAPQYPPRKELQRPSKRGRGRPKQAITNNPPAVHLETISTGIKSDVGLQRAQSLVSSTTTGSRPDTVHIGCTPVLRTDSKNPKRLVRASARQARSSAENDKSTAPTRVKRAYRKKDKVAINNQHLDLSAAQENAAAPIVKESTCTKLNFEAPHSEKTLLHEVAIQIPAVKESLDVTAVENVLGETEVRKEEIHVHQSITLYSGQACIAHLEKDLQADDENQSSLHSPKADDLNRQGSTGSCHANAPDKDESVVVALPRVSSNEETVEHGLEVSDKTDDLTKAPDPEKSVAVALLRVSANEEKVEHALEVSEKTDEVLEHGVSIRPSEPSHTKAPDQDESVLISSPRVSSHEEKVEHALEVSDQMDDLNTGAFSGPCPTKAPDPDESVVVASPRISSHPDEEKVEHALEVSVKTEDLNTGTSAGPSHTKAPDVDESIVVASPRAPSNEEKVEHALEVSDKTEDLNTGAFAGLSHTNAPDLDESIVVASPRVEHDEEKVEHPLEVGGKTEDLNTGASAGPSHTIAPDPDESIVVASPRVSSNEEKVEHPLEVSDKTEDLNTGASAGPSHTKATDPDESVVVASVRVSSNEEKVEHASEVGEKKGEVMEQDNSSSRPSEPSHTKAPDPDESVLVASSRVSSDEEKVEHALEVSAKIDLNSGDSAGLSHTKALDSDESNVVASPRVSSNEEKVEHALEVNDKTEDLSTGASAGSHTKTPDPDQSIVVASPRVSSNEEKVEHALEVSDKTEDLSTLASAGPSHTKTPDPDESIVVASPRVSSNEETVEHALEVSYRTNEVMDQDIASSRPSEPDSRGSV